MVRDAWLECPREKRNLKACDILNRGKDDYCSIFQYILRWGPVQRLVREIVLDLRKMWFRDGVRTGWTIGCIFCVKLQRNCDSSLSLIGLRKQILRKQRFWLSLSKEHEFPVLLIPHDRVDFV